MSDSLLAAPVTMLGLAAGEDPVITEPDPRAATAGLGPLGPLGVLAPPAMDEPAPAPGRALFWIGPLDALAAPSSLAAARMILALGVMGLSFLWSITDRWAAKECVGGLDWADSAAGWVAGGAGDGSSDGCVAAAGCGWVTSGG